MLKEQKAQILGSKQVKVSLTVSQTDPTSEIKHSMISKKICSTADLWSTIEQIFLWPVSAVQWPLGTVPIAGGCHFWIADGGSFHGRWALFLPLLCPTFGGFQVAGGPYFDTF